MAPLEVVSMEFPCPVKMSVGRAKEMGQGLRSSSTCDQPQSDPGFINDPLRPSRSDPEHTSRSEQP